MSEHRQEPWEILNPRDALIQAAKFAKESTAADADPDGRTADAEYYSALSLSLSTYALAMYRREGS